MKFFIWRDSLILIIGKLNILITRKKNLANIEVFGRIRMSNEVPDRFIVSSEEIIGEWDWNKRERCIVCNLPINNSDKIGRCPKCSHSAHLDHFLEWIKIKGICPFCKRKLKSSDLKTE